MGDQVSEFMAAHAPSDVRAAIEWLLDNGYTLVSRSGGTPFGATFSTTWQSRRTVEPATAIAFPM